MKECEIEEGKSYEGPGVCGFREVDVLFQVSGRTFVHWFCFLSVVRKDGSVIHAPNRTCSLKTFARWARCEAVVAALPPQPLRCLTAGRLATGRQRANEPKL